MHSLPAVLDRTLLDVGRAAGALIAANVVAAGGWVAACHWARRSR